MITRLIAWLHRNETEQDRLSRSFRQREHELALKRRTHGHGKA